jgi:hypothetical protein
MTDDGDQNRQDDAREQYAVQISEEFIHIPTPETELTVSAFYRMRYV